MKKENIQGSTASPPDSSATRTSEGGTSPLRSVFRGKWMAWIVLLASLFITFFAWNLARGIVLKRANDRFVFRAKTIELSIRERLHACAFLLQSGAGLFAGSEEITRAEWRTYVTALQIDTHYPGVQGLGFSKRILPSEKKAHIRQIREEGFPNYDIHPDGERPEYTSIIFLEPFDWRNQRAFGYDMFSEPTRKETMVMARDTGSAALSGKVTLLQETEKDVQAGFLMYLPVYRNGEVPETPEQRLEALRGYVYSPFRMNDFMQGLVKDKLGYVKLQIFDGDEPLKEALLYPNGNMESLLSRSDHVHFATYQSILEYAGRRWLLVFKTSPYFEENINTAQVNSILFLGIIISLLLFSVVLSLTKSRNQALSLADMTLDLEKANLELRREIEERKQAEDALRDKEHLLSESQRLGHIGSFLYEMTGLIRWSDELYRLYGVSPETFTPTEKSFFSLIHPDDRASMQVWIAACAAGEKPDALDFRINMPDGTVRFVRCWGDAVYDDENRLTYLAGTVLNITAQKLAEEELQRYSVELERNNKELQGALAKVKQLTGMLPICASCKKIRDDKGFWSGVETYVSEHSDAVFSHGLCPECEKKEYEALAQLIRENS